PPPSQPKASPRSVSIVTSRTFWSGRLGRSPSGGGSRIQTSAAIATTTAPAPNHAANTATRGRRARANRSGRAWDRDVFVINRSFRLLDAHTASPLALLFLL